MFKNLLKNKKAQQTAEYAILIALVVGAVIAMQTYAQRTIQARIRGAAQFLASGASDSDYGKNVLGTQLQYEPYYLQQDYQVQRDDTTDQNINPAINQIDFASQNTRTRSGGQNVEYSSSESNIW